VGNLKMLTVKEVHMRFQRARAQVAARRASQG
jgi:hypothetical protein